MKKTLTILLLTLVIFSKAQVDLSAGLMAWYPFKGNTQDASGNRLHGTASGGGLTNDKNNYTNAAYLFSSATDRITVPYNANLDFSSTKNLTVSAWFKPNSIGSVDGRLISISALYGKAYEIFLASPTTGADSGKVGFLNFSNGNTPKEVINILSTVRPAMNAWNLLVLTVDGNNGATKIYINNTQVASSGTMPVLPTSSTPYNYPILTIGNNPTFDWPFKGAMDEVRLYNRILNSNEISALFTLYSGITDAPISNEILLTPNPFNSCFEVCTSNVLVNQIQIFDLCGKLVYTESFQGTKMLELPQIPAGNYVVHLKNDKGVTIKKITKM